MERPPQGWTTVFSRKKYWFCCAIAASRKFTKQWHGITVRMNILNSDGKLLFMQIYTEQEYRIAVHANSLISAVKLLFAQIYRSEILECCSCKYMLNKDMRLLFVQNILKHDARLLFMRTCIYWYTKMSKRNFLNWELVAT